MQSTYAQKNETAQRAADNTAAAVHDNSPQSECLQRHASLANAAVQRAENPPRPNNTGLPDDLKNGIESLSGYSLDNVRVHYNSPKPATVQALAYTQGTDIHVAPGQEHALPHEAWHVAQQMAGRVTPTTNIGGMPVNDNAALEHEADVMGEKAVQCKMGGNGNEKLSAEISSSVVQQCGKGEKKKSSQPTFEPIQIGNVSCYKKSNKSISPTPPSRLSVVLNFEGVFLNVGDGKTLKEDVGCNCRLDRQGRATQEDFTGKERGKDYGNFQIQQNTQKKKGRRSGSSSCSYSCVIAGDDVDVEVFKAAHVYSMLHQCNVYIP